MFLFFFKNRRSLVFDVMRMISTQICWQDSRAKNVYVCAAKNITWPISGKGIDLGEKSLGNVVQMKEEMAVIFHSGSVVVLLPICEIENCFGRNFE